MLYLSNQIISNFLHFHENIILNIYHSKKFLQKIEIV